MADLARARRDLLPQRDDLFRQADPAPAGGTLRGAAAPGWPVLRGARRELARPGTALPAARTNRLRARHAVAKRRRGKQAVTPNDEPLREEQPNRYFDPHFKVDTAKILPG